MSPRPRSVWLHCPAHIAWVKDASQVIVVDEHAGGAHRLSGEQAAVWGWLSDGVPYHRLISLLAVLAGITPAEAQTQLEAMLRGWLRAGLLEAEEAGHG